MKKLIKALIYGEPGVGKSTFAVHAPKPFFFCTDPNYDWLVDFGAKEEDHVQLFSWEEAKKEFAKPRPEYETYVIDLTEDLFKWCEAEVCTANKWVHVSEPGYGKGYDITRTEYFNEICKLLNLPKNVILIMHGETTVTKDRRGVENYKYRPSTRLPDKVLDMIEGRVRFCLRAFANAEADEDGNITVNRYLSLSPDGTTEYGIIRGIYDNKLPKVIPLDWNTFYTLVTNATPTATAEPVKKAPAKAKPEVKEELKPELKAEDAPTSMGPTLEAIDDPVPYAEESVADVSVKDIIKENSNGTTQLDLGAETPEVEEKPVAKPVTTKADQMAAIKAKLAAIKASKSH